MFDFLVEDAHSAVARVAKRTTTLITSDRVLRSLSRLRSNVIHLRLDRTRNIVEEEHRNFVKVKGNGRRAIETYKLAYNESARRGEGEMLSVSSNVFIVLMMVRNSI